MTVADEFVAPAVAALWTGAVAHWTPPPLDRCMVCAAPIVRNARAWPGGDDRVTHPPCAWRVRAMVRPAAVALPSGPIGSPYTDPHHPGKLGHAWLSVDALPGSACAACACGWSTVAMSLAQAVTALRQHAGSKAGSA